MSENKSCGVSFGLCMIAFSKVIEKKYFLQRQKYGYDETCIDSVMPMIIKKYGEYSPVFKTIGEFDRFIKNEGIEFYDMIYKGKKYLNKNKEGKICDEIIINDFERIGLIHDNDFMNPGKVSDSASITPGW